MSWGRSKRIRKYMPGAEILGIFDLIPAIKQGRYVFVRGKAYHPTVLSNWSLASLEGACRYGGAHIAELTPEWIAAEQEKAEIEREEHVHIDSEFSEVTQ